jgi:hypothetical protein
MKRLDEVSSRIGVNIQTNILVVKIVIQLWGMPETPENHKTFILRSAKTGEVPNVLSEPMSSFRHAS